MAERDNREKNKQITSWKIHRCFCVGENNLINLTKTEFVLHIHKRFPLPPLMACLQENLPHSHLVPQGTETRVHKFQNLVPHCCFSIYLFFLFRQTRGNRSYAKKARKESLGAVERWKLLQDKSWSNYNLTFFFSYRVFGSAYTYLN